MNKKAADGIDAISGKPIGVGSKFQDPPNEQLQPLINLYGRGEFQQALDQAAEMLKQFPESLTLHNICGAAHSGMKQFDSAIDNFRQALKIKPDYANAYNNIGVALIDKGELDVAIDSFRQALKIKPNYAEAYNNMGVALKDKGELVAAIDSCKKALKIKPDLAEAYNNIGISLSGIGNLNAAIDSYKQALKIKPDYAEAYYNMGSSLKGKGDLESAIDSYKKALKINPGNADAYINMGTSLHIKGDLDAAIESYREALKIKPDYADAAFNLAGTAKNIIESKKWLEQCLMMNQNHLQAKLILSALEFYEGDKSNFNDLLLSPLKDHFFMRSFAWAFNLPELPELYFYRWALFDRIVEQSKKTRPFYEFGVWRGTAFRYLIKTFKKGYGFDTFEGLPEDWHEEKAGKYSSDGNIPEIKGGEFFVGKFEDTLPTFFSEPRPMASIINFDADLYSSTICALTFSKPVIDRHTILVFDEFIGNKNWEQDEYKALNDFCLNNNYSYEVLAISFFTKQAAIRLIGI